MFREFEIIMHLRVLHDRTMCNKNQIKKKKNLRYHTYKVIYVEKVKSYTISGIMKNYYNLNLKMYTVR